MAKVETVIEAEHKDGVGDGDGVCCVGFSLRGSRLIRDLPKFDLIHFFFFLVETLHDTSTFYYYFNKFVSYVNFFDLS